MRIYTHTNGAGVTRLTTRKPIRFAAANRDGTWSLWLPCNVGSWLAWCCHPGVTEAEAIEWLCSGEVMR